MRAGLCGVLDGLNLAWEKGFRKVIKEVDSTFAMKAIKEVEARGNNHHSLVMNIQRLLDLEWTIFVPTFVQGRQ